MAEEDKDCRELPCGHRFHRMPRLAGQRKSGREIPWCHLAQTGGQRVLQRPDEDVLGWNPPDTTLRTGKHQDMPGPRSAVHHVVPIPHEGVFTGSTGILSLDWAARMGYNPLGWTRTSFGVEAADEILLEVFFQLDRLERCRGFFRGDGTTSNYAAHRHLRFCIWVQAYPCR